MLLPVRCGQVQQLVEVCCRQGPCARYRHACTATCCLPAHLQLFECQKMAPSSIRQLRAPQQHNRVPLPAARLAAVRTSGDRPCGTFLRTIRASPFHQAPAHSLSSALGAGNHLSAAAGLARRLPSLHNIRQVLASRSEPLAGPRSLPPAGKVAAASRAAPCGREQHRGAADLPLWRRADALRSSLAHCHAHRRCRSRCRVPCSSPPLLHLCFVVLTLKQGVSGH